MSNTTIEDRLRALLNSEGVPEAKFNLWDQVEQGKIVGYRFCSVAYSFNSGTMPGWWYTVEQGSEHTEYQEEDIKPVQA